MAKKLVMKTKASIATGVFGVTPRTLRGWLERGVPGRRRDAFFNVVSRMARAEENPIQGTPKQIKDKLGNPAFVLVCLRHAFPRVWQ